MGTVTTLMPIWHVLRGGDYDLSGTVSFGGDSSGIANVTITITGDASTSTTTAADGTWSFDASAGTGLPNGSYTVTPTKTGHTFSPTSTAVTIATGAEVANFTGVAWLILDYFTVEDAAPIASPRTPDQTGGVTTYVQTDGAQATAGGVMTFTAQTTPVWGDQGFNGAGQTSDSGVALSVKLNVSTWEECGIGWWTTTTVTDPDNLVHAFQLNTTDGRIDNVNATPVITGLSTGTEYALSIIYRGVGGHHVVDGKLVWVS